MMLGCERAAGGAGSGTACARRVARAAAPRGSVLWDSHAPTSCNPSSRRIGPEIRRSRICTVYAPPPLEAPRARCVRARPAGLWPQGLKSCLLVDARLPRGIPEEAAVKARRPRHHVRHPVPPRPPRNPVPNHTAALEGTAAVR